MKIKFYFILALKLWSSIKGTLFPRPSEELAYFLRCRRWTNFHWTLKKVALLNSKRARGIPSFTAPQFGQQNILLRCLNRKPHLWLCIKSSLCFNNNSHLKFCIKSQFSISFHKFLLQKIIFISLSTLPSFTYIFLKVTHHSAFC